MHTNSHLLAQINTKELNEKQERKKGTSIPLFLFHSEVVFFFHLKTVLTFFHTQHCANTLLRFFLRFRKLLLCGYCVSQVNSGMKSFLPLRFAGFFLAYCNVMWFLNSSMRTRFLPIFYAPTFAATTGFFCGFSLPSFFSPFSFFLFSPFSIPSPPHTNTTRPTCANHTPSSVLRPRPCWTHAHAGGAFPGLRLRRDCDWIFAPGSRGKTHTPVICPWSTATPDALIHDASSTFHPRPRLVSQVSRGAHHTTRPVRHTPLSFHHSVHPVPGPSIIPHHNPQSPPLIDGNARKQNKRIK